MFHSKEVFMTKEATSEDAVTAYGVVYQMKWWSSVIQVLMHDLIVNNTVNS